jgi:hypothetical protein
LDIVCNPWDRTISAFHLLNGNDVPPPHITWSDAWLGKFDGIGAFFDKRPIPSIEQWYCLGRISLGNPVQRGHRFQRKADSNPVIADSR